MKSKNRKAVGRLPFFGNIENLGNSAFTLPVCRKNGIMNVILYGHTDGGGVCIEKARRQKQEGTADEDTF